MSSADVVRLYKYLHQRGQGPTLKNRHCFEVFELANFSNTCSPSSSVYKFHTVN